ncbi:MAG: ATP-binding protein [Heliobacteriaceae bacterium]|nr:ATP-binding protein [Heliobacteriaceae bacterium]
MKSATQPDVWPSRYRLLFNEARDMLLFLRPNGTILEANAAVVRAYGYSPAELVRLKLHDLRSEAEEQGEAGLPNRGEVCYETVHRRKDGTCFPVEVNLIPVAATNPVLIGIIRDISERKQNELKMIEARERVARAEQMASLGIMVAGIAHEMNQPLNVLKVTADSMLYWHQKGRPLTMPKLLEGMRKIAAQAKRLEEIVSQVRTYVRRDLRLKLVSCNLNDAVKGALNLMGNQFITHQIHLRKQLAPSPPLVRATQTHLEHIILNLLVNAMHSLAAVNYPVKEIGCVTNRVGENVVLEVWDNGPGINPAIRDLIFEPFFTTKSGGENMGLGLSIVRYLANELNGRVEVNTNAKGGATFRIEFPLAGDEGGRRD